MPNNPMMYIVIPKVIKNLELQKAVVSVLIRVERDLTAFINTYSFFVGMSHPGAHGELL
jgi:hypothetical protein